MYTRLDPGDEPVHYLAASRAKKVNGDNLGKAPLKLGKIGLDLCRAVVLDLTFRHRSRSEPASFQGNFVVVRAAGGLKQGFHFSVRKTVDETCFAEDCSSTAFNDFPQNPLKIFLRLLVLGQDIHGVLNGHCAEPLKPPPNFDAEIIGLGRDLMNEQQPSAF